MKRSPLMLAALVIAGATVSPAMAQGYGQSRYERSIGRAPWNERWQYDSGSDNDRHPERPYYQQGGGQQTGGPARNLLPDDGLHFVPR